MPHLRMTLPTRIRAGIAPRCGRRGSVIAFLADWLRCGTHEVRMNCFSITTRIFRFAVLILLAGFLASIFSTVAHPRPAEKHAFTVGDWEALRRARAVAVSPDG